LIQTLKESPNSNSVKNTGQLILSVLQEKLQELNSLLGNQGDNVNLAELTNVLRIEQQPPGTVVSNKYLEPAIVVCVDEKLIPLAKEGRLQVRSSLCFSISDEAIDRTLDNRQEILQGQLTCVVGADGKATFNKLKIMEVSSKHQHQDFCIQVQLEEVKKSFSSPEDKVRVIGNPVRSSPLHVQSRINNKRKRSLSCSGGKYAKRARGDFCDSSYVDITPLLILPQKEAANKLGISESMLCKRFKECTRRKWPYRYLRKIDKMIRMLTLNKKMENLTRDEHEKIERLKMEREECLHPVKIRITGADVVQLNTLSTASSGESPEVESDSYDSPSGPTTLNEEISDSVSYDDMYEEDEIALVVSTLHLMRQAVY